MGKFKVICAWLPYHIRRTCVVCDHIYHTCKKYDELAYATKQPDPMHKVFFSNIVQNLLKLSSNESLFKLIISDQTLIILK